MTHRNDVDVENETLSPLSAVTRSPDAEDARGQYWDTHTQTNIMRDREAINILELFVC